MFSVAALTFFATPAMASDTSSTWSMLAPTTRSAAAVGVAAQTDAVPVRCTLRSTVLGIAHDALSFIRAQYSRRKVSL